MQDREETEIKFFPVNYESVGVVALLPANLLSQANEVIAVSRQPKTSSYHPNELDNHLDETRQTSQFSVIQALPGQLRSPLTFANPMLQPPQPASDELMELEDAQIPVTVQICSRSVQDEKESSDSEEDSSNMQPVLDHEPDPGSPEAVDVSDMENKCYMCFKKFRQKKNMYAHIRKIHSAQPKIAGGIICPLCKMHALRQEHLRHHLLTLHHIKIEKEEREFDFLSEFLTWKQKVEKATGCAFISKSSSKVLACNQTKTYFKCQKSGWFEADKIEKRKKQGFAMSGFKIGATCPAAMELTEYAKRMVVTFWSTHVGHSVDPNPVPESIDPSLKAAQREGSAATVNSAVISDGAVKKNSRSTKNKSIDKKRQRARHRTATKALVIQKARDFLQIIENTNVEAEARTQICSMIDNLIATVRRKAVKVVKRKNSRVFLKEVTASADDSESEDLDYITEESTPDIESSSSPQQQPSNSV